MESKTDIALSKFTEGYNCAQSVLYSFCKEVRLDTIVALKLACGFGAGMGRKEEVCGAVTGGIMAIGAQFGRNELSGPEATEITYQKTRELMEEFERRHGTYLCKKLLDGCDLTTEAGQQIFKETNLKKSVCMPCVQSVVEILEVILFSVNHRSEDSTKHKGATS
jgi:C_GCAxxG_C_C family probable redox protein